MGNRVVFRFRHVTMDHVKSKVIPLDGPWTMAGDGIPKVVAGLSHRYLLGMFATKDDAFWDLKNEVCPLIQDLQGWCWPSFQPGYLNTFAGWNPTPLGRNIIIWARCHWGQEGCLPSISPWWVGVLAPRNPRRNQPRTRAVFLKWRLDSNWSCLFLAKNGDMLRGPYEVLQPRHVCKPEIKYTNIRYD